MNKYLYKKKGTRGTQSGTAIANK